MANKSSGSKWPLDQWESPPLNYCNEEIIFWLVSFMTGLAERERQCCLFYSSSWGCGNIDFKKVLKYLLMINCNPFWNPQFPITYNYLTKWSLKWLLEHFNWIITWLKEWSVVSFMWHLKKWSFLWVSKSGLSFINFL